MDRYKLNPTKIHLMGHSLGAQVSSYFAKTFPGIYRITAFDPAQPGFEGCSKEVRLDKSDATFVDVLHTSGRPFIPLLGCGFIGPVGNSYDCLYISRNVLCIYVFNNTNSFEL